MTDPIATSTAPVSPTTVTVKVWDWPVRAFHWATVILLCAAWATAEIGGNAMVWHMRVGYALLTLVLFRVLWGFAGSRYARFGSFLRGPADVVGYAKSLAARLHAPTLGHNPLGGWSVVALLALLLVQASTGLFANDDIATDGPLVKLVSKAASDRITGIHHFNFNLLLTLVAIHVSAVVFHAVALKENLVHPMLTGVKRVPAPHAAAGGDEPSPVRAIALFAACVFAVWGLVTRF